MSRPPGRRLRPSQHLWAASRVCVVLDRRSGFGWLAESRAREPIFVYRRAFCEPPAQVPVIWWRRYGRSPIRVVVARGTIRWSSCWGCWLLRSPVPGSLRWPVQRSGPRQHRRDADTSQRTPDNDGLRLHASTPSPRRATLHVPRHQQSLPPSWAWVDVDGKGRLTS